jgi:hypothetical protein
VANDPRGSSYRRGGEINTRPTATVDEQLEWFEELLALHPEARVNHRTSLHVHVRVPGLSEDLQTLKRVFQFVSENHEELYSSLENLRKPEKVEFASKEEFESALKCHRRRTLSHQYQVPQARVEEALSATTVAEFFDAHSRPQANGGRAYGLTTRAGVNLLQLKETDTVEFRHFTNTLDVGQLRSCFVWARNFVPMVLDGASVSEMLCQHEFDFPEFAPFNHAMEVGYQFTNFDKNPRRVVEERLKLLRSVVDIDHCTAEETMKAIAEL